MSTSDPRRGEPRDKQPATAVSADATGQDDDTERSRHAGSSSDTVRDDSQRTRVLDTDDAVRDRDRHGTEGQRTVATPVVAPPPPAQPAPEAQRPLDHRTVLQREKEQFGGMRFWLAFFGWLTAIGLAVLLGAIAAGILTAVGNSNGATSSSSGLQGLGVAGAIVTAVILFIAYYAGGYVAGRMARFDGVKQGVAVWLWAIIISILAAIAGAIGSQFGLFSQIGNVAQVPFNAQTFTAAGILTIVAALIVSLVGAVLGGLAGMHYHRKVDRSAFGA